MITDEELKISNQSYLHKDFYQIYPEILEIVNKITERWDPSSSNESDPGVVILKLLAFMGDKLNYNIDKNILECFMPSATQEDSMRKLCDMMGYDMHYYRSATTPVSFMWTGGVLSDPAETSYPGDYIIIPKFSTVSNSSTSDAIKKVNYVLTGDVKLLYKGYIGTVLAIEGTCVDFTVNDDNIVKISNLDDNRRLYFPELQVAENGVFIESVSDKTMLWDRVLNLNTCISTSKVAYWKFCFDSRRKLPYIQFPDNIADLIGEGLTIKYIRTSGVDGNIAAKTLTTLTSKTTVTYVPADSTQESKELNIADDGNTYLTIQNVSYTQNGADVETLDEAYAGFKRTIGTFDTLVTCRDYANAIYNMVVSDIDTSNYVSNVQVSDIRDDINFTTKIATFDQFGVGYIDQPTTHTIPGGSEVPDIDHFDLYIYPLNPVNSLYVAKNYDNTFKPNVNVLSDITANLADYKTLSHSFKQISSNKLDEGSKNIFAIKNYYHLTANISTTTKVTKYEGSQILNNIYVALYKNFNARKLDYGEEISYDAILKVMQEADPRIKFVALDDPELTTKVMTGDGVTHSLDDTEDGYKIHLLAKNVLAGRVPLFDYDTRFDYSFGQGAFNDSSVRVLYGDIRNYPDTLSPSSSMYRYSITAVSTNLTLPKVRLSSGYKLKKNEIIQLKAMNLVTKLTMPVGVNYYFVKNGDITVPVAANTDYKLVAGDLLYINYTDSNDVAHFIKYSPATGTNKATYVDNDSLPQEWSGIIRPNFDLYDSAFKQSPQAGSIQESGINKEFPNSGITVMMSLKGLYQIEERDFVKIKLSTSPTYCYWTTNEDNYLIFTRISTGGSSPYSYEYTLDNNEYFFYTDSLKNTLATLGPGTTLHLVQSVDMGPTIRWLLPKSSEMDIDDIASRGIGAFADTDWHVEKFNQNNYLELIENQLILLGEDDVIFLTGTASGDEQNVNNEWKELSATEVVRYNGNDGLPKFENLDNPWEIRSFLNLNLGPELVMTLEKDTDSHPIIREITLYTSAWLADPDSTTPEHVTEDTDLSTLYERIITSPVVGSITNRSDTISIKSNYLTQQTGGPLTSMHRYSYAGVLEDDLRLYTFADIGCSINNTDSLAINGYADNFTQINDVSSINTITLPVRLPTYTFGVFMIYHKISPQERIDEHYVRVTSDEESITEYREDPGGMGPQNTLILNTKDMTVIRINQSCTLTIDLSAINSGSLTFSDLSVINGKNDRFGVNVNLLGIQSEDESLSSDLLDTIKALDTKGLFLYNVPINNSKQIDVNTMDEYSWFDPNNICNKFVISQLDTDMDGIQIAKSSRLGKW